MVASDDTCCSDHPDHLCGLGHSLFHWKEEVILMANRKEREAHPEESFDGGYHLYAEQKHRERVAKNPDRIAYAIQQFESHGIEYQLKNGQTGHFHCWRKTDDQMFQFYAGTGKIMGRNIRGIHNLVKILEGVIP